jgi:hypothetical protein
MLGTAVNYTNSPVVDHLYTLPSAWSGGFDFRATVGYVTDPPNTTYVLGTTTTPYPTTRTINGQSVDFGWNNSWGSCAGTTVGGDIENLFDPRLAGDNYISSGVCGSFLVHLPNGSGVYKLRLAQGFQTSSSQHSLRIYDGGDVSAGTADTAGTNVTLSAGSSQTFQPHMAGRTITINSVNTTVTTYTDNRHLVVSTNLGNTTAVAWSFGVTPILLATITNNTTLATNTYADASGVIRTSDTDWVANNVEVSFTFTTNVLNIQIGGVSSTNYTGINTLHVSQ